MAQPRKAYFTQLLSRAFDLRGQPSFDLDDRIAPVYNLAPSDITFQHAADETFNAVQPVGQPSVPSYYPTRRETTGSGDFVIYSGIRAGVSFKLRISVTTADAVNMSAFYSFRPDGGAAGAGTLRALPWRWNRLTAPNINEQWESEWLSLSFDGQLEVRQDVAAATPLHCFTLFVLP